MERKHLDNLCKRLVDEGQPILAGFVGARLTGHVPADATAEQLEQFKHVFMAGAQHLWGMLFSFLEEGSDCSPNDERRMAIVHQELEVWYNEQAAKRCFTPQPPMRGMGQA